MVGWGFHSVSYSTVCRSNNCRSQGLDAYELAALSSNVSDVVENRSNCDILVSANTTVGRYNEMSSHLDEMVCEGRSMVSGNSLLIYDIP